MNDDPKLPDADDESDPDTVTTPGGQVGEIEDAIDESDAEVVPDSESTDD